MMFAVTFPDGIKEIDADTVETSPYSGRLIPVLPGWKILEAVGDELLAVRESRNG